MNILVIEDDSNMATIIKLSLEKIAGYSVDVAPSPDQAKQSLTKKAYDLILLDYFLPGTDGLELLASLQNKTSHRPLVIFLTGQSDPYVLDKMKRSSALGFIIKPFDPLDMIRDIKAMTAMKVAA